tara:strand:+ start:2955 stop:4658 length:1704 start_codon:yes stop_codon:yes gene_type:complete
MKGSPNQVVTDITNAVADRVLTVGTVTDEQQDLNAEANLTFDGSTLTVAGNLTVTGTTTTVSTTNTVISDKLIELANGTSGTPSGDAGIVVERGSSANAGIVWDESGDTWVACTTSATGASTGDLTLTDADFKAASLDVSGDIDVDGTANLDAVDIDGAVQIDSTVTVGANDQGYDVIFYGDAASANLTWDTSEDDLILNGAARIVIPDGQLVLGSTAVTSTAAELNLLDGVSGLVQADFTKLAAVDASAAELNVLDGIASLDTDLASVSGSDDTLASAKAIKSYVDAQVTAQDLDATTDSGTIAIDLDSETLTVAGGEGIDTSATGNTITIACEESSASNKGAVIVSGGTGATVSYSSGTATVAVDAAQTQITSVGTIGTGTWQGTAIASAYLDSDTAHLSGTQTFTGAKTFTAAVTVGANDAGHDVILYGDTASANVTFDASADDLIFNGAAACVIPEGQLVLGSTAMTATAAELNLLDNVSGLVQADFTKLAAIDATEAEIDMLDGMPRGNIIYGNPSAATARLAPGGANQVLTSDGTDISWQDAAGGSAADDSNTILHMQVFA